MGDDDEAVDVDVDGAARAVRSLRVRTGEVGAGSGGDRSRAVMAMGRVRGGMTRRMTVTESIALCATPHATVLAYRTLRDCGKRMDEATLSDVKRLCDGVAEWACESGRAVTMEEVLKEPESRTRDLTARSRRDGEGKISRERGGVVTEVPEFARG